jgi:predicted ArsR family transcriptional regulator
MVPVWRACYNGPTRQGETTRQRIVAAVTQQPGLTMQGIATQTGLSYSQVRKQCPLLTSEGLIAMRRQGRQKHYYPAR